MKFLTFLTLFLCSFSINAQLSNEDLIIKKNSFGISLSNNSIWYHGDILTLRLDYSRILDSKNEIRTSIDVTPFTLGREALYGASLGWNRYVSLTNKFNIYVGAELSYRHFNYISYSDPNLEEHPINYLNLNTLAGLEYKVSETSSFFMEPQIFSYTILDRTNRYGVDAGFAWNKFHLFKASSFGARIRF